MTDQDEPRKYSVEEQAELRRRALDVIEAERLTKKDAADQAGIPYGTFTPWLGGTYPAEGSKTADQVARWLNSRETRQLVRTIAPRNRFVMTKTATAIHQLLGHAQHMPDIVVVTGDPGTGKTEAVNAYARSNPHVYTIVGEPSINNVGALLSVLAHALGSYRGGARYLLSRLIANKLHGSSALLVVDEAQHLSSEMLDQLRTYYDQCRVGIALVGNASVITRLEGGARRAEYAQLFRRVGMRLRRPKPLAEDVTALLAEWGVEDPALQKRLRNIAAKPGALGVMSKVFRLAQMVARNDGRPMASADVELAYQQVTDMPMRDDAA